MSGGPIFGFRQLPNGECRYWVAAVQSWWDPGARTIYGCSVPIFARANMSRISRPRVRGGLGTNLHSRTAGLFGANDWQQS